MISFKDIELKDKELITSYTQHSPRQPQQITMAFCNPGTGTDLSQPMYL